MRTVNNDIKTALDKYTTQRKGRIKVGNTFYDVYNVNYLQDCYEDGKVIGNAIASQLEFDIPYVNKFDEFIYYDGIWTGSDYDYVEIGKFNVFDDEDEDEFTKHITAFDNLLLFNVPYEANSTYPTTLYGELENICNQAGVTLINQSIPNGDFVVENNQFVNGESLKTVLKAICGISGTFATIKNDSLKLQLVNETNVSIDKSQHQPVTWKRRSYGINQVILGMENVIGEYAMREDAEDIALHGVHKLVINDNPFAYTQSKRMQLIDDLFDQVKGFGYIPYEMNYEWLNYLEVGDTITIDDIDTIVLRINGHSPDALKSEMSAPAIIDGSIEYVNNTDSIENQVKRTEIIVDKNTQEIKALAEKVVDIADTVEGIGHITYENANVGSLHNLEIRGNISLVYPNDETRYGYSAMISDEFIVDNDVYISEGIPYSHKDATYPSTTLYPKNALIQVDETIYELDLDYLNYMSELVHDKYVYQDGKQWIERNVGIDSSGNMYALDHTIIENRADLTINIDANSTLTLLSFGGAILKSEYLLENIYTDVFATEAYVNSEIKVASDEINLQLDAKVGDDEIVSKINLGIEEGQGVINLTGNTVTIDSDNFQLDSEGNVNCNDAVMNDAIIDDATINDANINDATIRNASIIDGNIILKSTGETDPRINITDYSNTNYLAMSNNFISIYENNKTVSISPRQISLYYNSGSSTYDQPLYIRNDGNNCLIRLKDYANNTKAELTGHNIYVEGIVTATDYHYVSREELKENIEKFTKGLDILKNIDIYSYNFKSEKKDDKKKKYGVVIGDKYNYAEEITNDDNSGVNLYSFISICCQSIKEQQEEIEQLKKEIKSLKEDKYGKNNI